MLVGLVTLAAAAEMVSAATIFSTIALLGDPDAMYGRWPRLIASFVAHSPLKMEPATAALTLVAVVLLVKNALTAAMLVVRGRVMAESIDAAFAQIVTRILSVPYAVHLRTSSAELLSHATAAVDTAYRIVLASAVSVIAEGMVTVALALVVLKYAPLPAIAAIAVIGILLVVLAFATRNATLQMGRGTFDSHRELLGELQSISGGIEEIKAFRREPYFIDRILRTNRRYARSLQGHVIALPMPRVIIESAFVVMSLVVVALVGGTSNRLLPLFALFAYAGFRMIPAMNRIVFHIDEMRHGRRAIEQLTSGIMGEPVPQAPSAERSRTPFSSSIEVRDLAYRHHGVEQEGLDGVSMTIRRGESVALVGRTGSGKTTLLRLMAGILTPSGGSIAIDRVPLGEWLAAAPLRIGYVPQSIYLLDDTLRRNIAFGVPDADIDHDRVAKVVAIAQLGDFVAALPQGIDTVVGERGSRMSGGERQRLAMARALYHDPEILLFDEPTTALDAATEARLAAAIDAIRGEKTVVIAAHGANMIARCDRVIGLERGRVLPPDAVVAG